MSKTIALAKKLGLARYRSLDGSDNTGNQHRQPGTIKCDQETLQFLLILDFESTCWEDRSQAPPPEIIEFPVVLLSLRTGEVVAEFHHYCLPIENPRLSPFCKNLTGITQNQVDDGVPLATCLTLFRRWLAEMSAQHKVFLHGEENGHNTPNATCVTWSDWDLSLCLENECKRRQIRKPECLNTWIDIRAVYKTFYNRRPQGLNGALRELGLAFEGREHSGIEDARNTARLVWRMVQAGCPLSITATRDERSRAQAFTAHRKYDEDEEEGGRPYKRSKWKHFKPLENPKMVSGTCTSNSNNNKESVPVISITKTPDDVERSEKTPVLRRLPNGMSRIDSGYESPHPVHGTPPLCCCGRRCRKRQVYKPGPNTGKVFWSCNLRGTNTKAGCNFFLWASA